MPLPAAAEALERLVNQFTDPLSFFRELVQNSVDAGSAEVDISLEHRDGVMTIRVDDYGKGMNREIIDTRLTRLFSSRKDGDLSQIGKFGIGFVSVFAIAPDAVAVDTSRDGQNWRILFHKDRSFNRIARNEPVEGTKITIVKRLTEEEYERFLERSREVLRYWCRFVEAEVRFQGELLTQPFALDAPCQVRYREPGTEVVVGYRRDFEPFLGFYNGGLTLLESSHESPRHVAVIVNSQYLEHTMARDDVRKDENFRKAMAIADRLLAEDLPRRLAEQLGAALADGGAAADFGFLCRALAHQLGPEREWSWAAADLAHGGGHAEDGAWVAIPGEDHCPAAAHLIYGPYARDIPAGTYQARWWLTLDGDDDARGVTLDVHDAHNKEVLASRDIAPGELRDPGELEVVNLEFRCEEGAVLELRTRWHDTAGVRQTRVTVTTGERIDVETSGFADLRLFRTPGGQRATLGEVARSLAEDLLLTATTESPVVKALEEWGRLVVLCRAEGPERRVLEALAGGPPADAHRRYCLPRPVQPPEQAAWEPLRRSLLAILKEHGARVSAALLGRFDGAGSPIRDWVAVAVRSPGRLAKVRAAARLGSGLLTRRRALVINARHPTVRRLLVVARAEPEVAAYLMAKLFFLRGKLDPGTDAELAALAWQRRWKRSNG